MPQLGERRTSKSGRPIVYTSAGWAYADRGAGGGTGGADATDTKGVQASAEQRGRVNITFDPALEAERTLTGVSRARQADASERTSGNVFNDEWGARLLDSVGLDGMARHFGGRDYQQFESASRAFESAVLPILSGAAVTESEAKRMIRAALPQFGDDEATLRDKSRRRQQMLNGAARGVGAPAPFPESAADRRASGASGPMAGRGPMRGPGSAVRVNTPADAQRLRPGTRYVTPDGTVMIR